MTSLVGTAGMIRLVLRRDRVLLPLWAVLPALLPMALAATFRSVYDTAAEREEYYLSTASNPSITALIGRAYSSSVGGLTAQRMGFFYVVVALLSLLTVIRHSRAEEEAGRRELVGATVVGREAGLAAALVVTWLANLALGLLTSLGLIAVDLPAAGSFALGLSIAGTGCVFATVGAVTAQLSEGAGVARGLAIGVLVLCYLVRAAGDASAPGEGTSWLTWLSPLGWAERVQAYAGDHWWVLLLLAGLALALVAPAFALSAHRDVDAGIVPPRLGPAEAPTALRGAVSLAWWLHRATLLGWTLGFAAYGAVVGAVAQTATDAVKGNPQLEKLFTRLGGTESLSDAYVAANLGVLGLVGGGYGIQAALRARSQEVSQRAEPVLAGSVSRLRWINSHLLFAVAGPAVALAAGGLAAGVAYGLDTGDVGGQVPRSFAGAMAQLPAVWILSGLAAALFGLLPRLSALAWGALVAFFVIAEFGQGLNLDQWILDLSPFTHIPKLPGGEVVTTPLVVLTVLGAALVVSGVAGFRRRDIG